jgi:3-oxoacyl-[acyl-carrier-protein] synthase II
MEGALSKRRVVVTGIGILCPVGLNLEESWKNILAGVSGIVPITDYDTTDFSSKIAGLVKNFDSSAYGISNKDARKMDMFIQYAVAAASQALNDADLHPEGEEAERCGTSIGAGIGGLGTISVNHENYFKSGCRKISPFFIPASIINMAAGHVSILNNLRGPSIACATACSTGTHSIGLAGRMIQNGDADVMICGGTEKASVPMGIGGFCALKALSTRNDEPEKASRPWDVDRDGFVLGDGAGIMVLEELEHAKARGAKIYAEFAGFGMSSDAHHMTAPPDDGAGAALSMKNAIKDAGITPDQVQYINAHGTSTHLGDLAEIRAVRSVFGDSATKVMVNSTKSMTGHLLGAAGAIEAIFSVMCIHDGMVPPTINVDNVEPECADMDLCREGARKADVEYALSNSFGFGGTNGSILFKKYR